MKKIILPLLFCLSCYLTQSAVWYINSTSGDDANSGRFLDQPWKTLTNLSSKKFSPGDSLLFAAGTAYKGGCVFTSSGTKNHPVYIGVYSAGAQNLLANERSVLGSIFKKYGAGLAPSFTNPDWDILNGNVFQIHGGHIIIEGLYFHDNAKPPGSNKKNQNVQKMGAIYLAEEANYSIIKNCEFYRTPVGIKIKSSHNLISHNYLHDADEMMAQSWGPIAIMIVAPYNEISHNRITGYGAYGGPYGSDGGVIELDGVDTGFHASSINIHHNVSINNHGFLEIAARNVDSIMVAFNLSDDKNQFIGGGSMKAIQVLNNTVIRIREPNVDRFVFWTFYPEGCGFTIWNNIFVVAKDIQVFGPVRSVVGHKRTGIGNHPHNNNLYYSPGNPDVMGIPKDKTEIIGDPGFVDFVNGNYRLTKSSAAIGKAIQTLFTFDLDGYSTGRNQGLDIGAYDF